MAGLDHKAKTKQRAEYLSQLKALNLSDLAKPLESKYYHTYSHFDNPEDLASSLVFNQNGVPYSSVGDPHIDFINPLFPAYFGIVCYNHFLETNDANSLKKFKQQCDFLKDYGEWEEEYFILPYQFDYPEFDLKSPWFAGITQALAASLFSRAQELFPEEEYSLYRKGSLKALFKPKSKGGIYCKTPDGHDWIEEYPSGTPSLVLNGFIFCIVAIIEDAKTERSNSSISQAKTLIESLLGRLHHYKYGKHIRHNLRHWDFSNLEYQGLHVNQFLHLHKLTNLKLFKDLAEDFQGAFEWEDFYNFYGMSTNDRNPSNKIEA